MAKKQTEVDMSTKKTRDNKKHFVMYNNGGVISATTPKDWARGHRHFFPRFNFITNTPTVNVIENYLITIKGFSKITNEEIVICYNYIEL